jgi:predicted nucleic acid-binding protein
MNPTVYVETSVISYLTARPSRDLVVAAHQDVTRRWWEHAQRRFQLVISRTVEDELTLGDPIAASLRLEAAKKVPLLPVSGDVVSKVNDLRANLRLPEKALADVYHIAYCVVYEVDFLVTWNCTHIANPSVLRDLRDLSHAKSFFLPTIVTPLSLMED